jgi:hypothetical protein
MNMEAIDNSQYTDAISKAMQRALILRVRERQNDQDGEE